MRTSHVVYVAVRLVVGGRGFFLLQRHAKWGDWSLVGGHVEPYDGDWLAAARREANEELTPLRAETDFTLERIAGAPSHWGPLESRSAHGAPTNYEAAWFALMFLRDPERCLNALPSDAFMLVDREVALGATCERKITSLLRRLDASLPGGLASVPVAWEKSVPVEAIHIDVRRGPSQADERSVALR
jgi:hypothetical protein